MTRAKSCSTLASDDWLPICRDKYEEAIEKLSIRPLRIQAGKGVVVKQTADGLVVETSPAIAGEQQDDA